MKMLLGADPEMFVMDPGTQQFVSGHGLIQGTKTDPFPVKNGAVQVDGMALEFNINPAENAKQFVSNIQQVMAQLAAMVPQYTLVATPVAHFSEEVFANCPPMALELGCDPDYDAYTGMPNDPPDGKRDFRTGAGHIHVGWTNGMDITDPEHIEACQMMAKQLDVFLGVPSVLLDPDNKRREMYGRAGCYRPKPYGMEYRVLSNFWLKDPVLMNWVYAQAKLAFTCLLDGNQMYNKHKGTVHYPQEIINSSSKVTARELSNHNNIPHPYHNTGGVW